jgi:superfamily II DNA or RNA helicase
MLELRDYQSETVDAVLARYRQNPHGSAKFVWATGLGKTIGFSAIAHAIRQMSDTNVLIIAHRDELLNQAAEKYRFIDPTAIIGKVGSGVYEWGAPVTVASIQTICRPNHLKQIKLFNYGLVIIDEVHHAHEHNEYGKVLSALPDAFKVGVTATDMRLDKRSNDAIFGQAIVNYGIRWGIANGHLCDLRAVAIKTETTLDNVKTSRNMEGETDFQVGELANAIDTDARNARIVAAWKEHAQGRRTICFGVTVAHAAHIAEAFRSEGIEATVVSGETPHEERQQLYAALAAGSLKVLCTVQVLTEGFDLPRLDCIILARPTQSTGLFLQCIGRGTRKAPGKTDCLILDLTDNVFNHKLEPVSLSKAIGLRVKDNELISEAEEREKRETAEKKAQVRKLHAHRDTDLHIDLLEKLLWQERTDGLFVLEIGREKHRIAIVPEGDGYSVWARLFPGYEAQRWGNAMPLDWAQDLAEKKARMLLADPRAISLVDRQAAWRNDPASEKMLGFLRWKRIPHDPATITKGEAGDLIDAWKQQDEARKAAREARLKAKMGA